jgi:Cd2+/Zn2+-exporting ATPase
LSTTPVLDAPPSRRPEIAELTAAPPARRSAWTHYRPILTSRDFLVAAATGLLALASWVALLVGGPAAAVNALGLAAALIGGALIAGDAVGGVMRGKLNVDELVTIAIIAAIFVQEYLGAALVAFMMLFGKVLEDVTAARADRALEGLGRLVPATARIKDPTGGTERTVPVEQVRVGDVVVVRPGERLPVDGVVVAGRAGVEEAAITGEPLPVEKAAGDEVFAGTLATGGALEVRVSRIGEATALGRIAALVQEAEGERAPIVRTADRLAKWFTPGVLGLAALVYLVRGELLPAVSVLVVACPCALVLATPTAIVAGIARGATRGILIKGGARLEAAGHVDAVCLDKTGTLTRGQPAVQRVVLLDGTTHEREVLAYAAAAERLSEHPLARAVLAAAEARGAPVPNASGGSADFEAVAGKGVAARIANLHPAAPPVHVVVGRPEFLAERGIEWPAAADGALQELETAGQTPLAVALDGRAAAVIGVADVLREEAVHAIRELRDAGLKRIVLLTGDREGPARAVAQAVGIAPQDVHARLLPEQKVEWVKRLRAEGHRVAMIGDGVNDAPALAAADVAVAMGAAGTDLAMVAADVVLMTDDLRQAAAAILLGRKTLTTIRQNLLFAGIWNAVAVGLVVFGSLGIVAGAIVHNLGSVLVVVNAARLVNARISRV